MSDGNQSRPKTTYVDLETARAARGLRLAVVEGIPSPWSEAAKGIFHVKEIPFVAVRLGATDKAGREWTRVRNAPAAMYDQEPARSGWADILELAERLAPARSLVPSDPAARLRMFGLAHEVMGEGALLWSSRLLTVHAGITTDGARGFPTMVATYLGKRYGYDPARVDVARKRVVDAWALLGEALGDRPYYFGDALTALDIYSAAAVNLFALPPDESCPMFPVIRATFDSMRGDVAEPPPALVRHRDRMYAQHLELPIAL